MTKGDESSRAERLALLRGDRPFTEAEGIVGDGRGVSFQVLDQSLGRLVVGGAVLFVPLGLEEDDEGRPGWFVPLGRVAAWEEGAPVDAEERAAIAAVLRRAIEAMGATAAIEA